jgi:hypothetical protein
MNAAFPMSNLLSRASLRASLHYVSLPMPGDECETWTREQLVEMNARFVDRLEQAFELGLESRASAAGQVKLPASTGPRWVTPLPREIAEGLWRSSAANALAVVTR